MVELLKGSISLFIALSRVDDTASLLDHPPKSRKRSNSSPKTISSASKSFLPESIASFDSGLWIRRAGKLRKELFSTDCWKLSIPAILYVIQNNLQFVAASNLDVATFQVTYQMKILTTAAFSVLMLGKRLTSKKWLALLFLAIGVGIVQIQSGAPAHAPSPAVAATPTAIPAGTAADPVVEALTSLNETITEAAQAVFETAKKTTNAHDVSEMNPFVGFMAVSLACLTSGLAGVYFEMVLKGSKADLWVRNVQLSMFSLLPALAPVLFSSTSLSLTGLFKNFGFWAWCTVFIQVFGGLITAIVIKYSDNIMKGFATSLSIVISSLASVILFEFSITPSFVVGAFTVLGATASYNSPDAPTVEGTSSTNGSGGLGLSLNPLKRNPSGQHGTVMSPASPNAPILGGHGLYNDKKRSSIASLKGLASSLGLGSPSLGSTTAYSDTAYSPGARTSSSSDTHLAPNGMDPARYSPYHTPTSNPLQLPSSRTNSSDLYGVAPPPSNQQSPSQSQASPVTPTSGFTSSPHSSPSGGGSSAGWKI